MKGLFQLATGVLLLLACAAVPAGLSNKLRPSGRIPWVEDWSKHIEAKARLAGLSLADVQDASALLKTGRFLLLDARPVDDYRRGHLPGARSLPYEDVNERIMDFLEHLTPEQPVLAYCSGLECDESFLLASFLRQQGFTNITLFAEGFAGWAAAGMPVETGAPP